MLRLLLVFSKSIHAPTTCWRWLELGEFALLLPDTDLEGAAVKSRTPASNGRGR